MPPVEAYPSVPNSEGTCVNKPSGLHRLKRFLCLGSVNGPVCVHNYTQELGPQNVRFVNQLLANGHGEDVVAEVESFSKNGRVARQDTSVLVLAMCARLGDDRTKRRAYDAVERVCRTPTQLFQFVELCKNLNRTAGAGSGWGRAHRRAIRRWYLRFRNNPLRLAQHVTKYKKRKGWSHVDVLRLAHPKPRSGSVKVVLGYVTKGLPAAVRVFPPQDGIPVEVVTTLSFLKAVEEVKRFGNSPDDVQRICAAIREHNLVREHVPTQMLNSIDIWKALLINMPLTAMIRNLGKMSSMNMLGPGSEAAQLVVEKLHNEAALEYARIHPFNLLLSMLVHKQGRGELGHLTWRANTDIIKAMDDAFYLSFKYVEPTGKRYCLAVDLGGSMTSPVTWSNGMNAREAAAALSMVTVRSEEQCEVVGFSETVMPLAVNRNMLLTDVVNVISDVPVGVTDCSAPILWARRENKEFDVFIVYTASETAQGHVSAADALREYRHRSGIHNAKLIVCAFASNGFTIADPNDPYMLDMAGLDSNCPATMDTFIRVM